MFDRNGFHVFDCLRPQVWQSRESAWWYMQNLFAFIHRDQVDRFPDAARQRRDWPSDLVHPRAYERATVPSEMSPRMLKEILRALPYFPSKIGRQLKK